MWRTDESGWLVTCVVLILAFGLHMGVAAEEAPSVERVNLVEGLPYWISLAPDKTYPDSGRELTDGMKGPSAFGHMAWQGHLRNEFRVVTFDLGAVKPVDEVNVGFLHDPSAGVNLPNEVHLYTSVNGRDWKGPKTVTRSMMGTPSGAARREAKFVNVGPARYVRIVFTVYMWAFIDEVEVWGEDRELDVEGPTDLLDLTDPYLGFDADGMGPALSVHIAPDKNIGRYLPIGTEAAGGARHIMLIYTHERWTVSDALPYVAYSRPLADPADQPVWEDWFFDSFLFLALRHPSGFAFDAPSRGTPARWEQWMWFLDYLFTPGQQMDAFNTAVAEAKKTIDDPDYKAKVFVMIPYPMIQTTNFGDPTGLGRSLDFSPFPNRWEESINDRLTAIQAYIDEFMRRWNEHEFEHLELVGLYWLAESISGPTDYELLQRVAPLVKELGLKFLWIPYYGANGWHNWEALGFDAAIYQPNYMFNASVPLDRFRQVTDAARRYGMGIEIEASSAVFLDGRDRYLAYLDAGVQYGYMDTALHAYYQDVKVLRMAYGSIFDHVRELYDLTYQYVKGTYRPRAN